MRSEIAYFSEQTRKMTEASSWQWFLARWLGNKCVMTDDVGWTMVSYEWRGHVYVASFTGPQP
jgi:hypothetical protein